MILLEFTTQKSLCAKMLLMSSVSMSYSHNYNRENERENKMTTHSKTIKQFVGIDTLCRKEDGTEMKHDEIYTKVVEAIGLEVCEELLPVKKEMLVMALKNDDIHFNTIPLKLWDVKFPFVKREARKVGITSMSMSEGVCILKQSARMAIEQK